MLNKCLYHPCPFCEGRNGIYHISFECIKSKELSGIMLTNAMGYLLTNGPIPNYYGKNSKVVEQERLLKD